MRFAPVLALTAFLVLSRGASGQELPPALAQLIAEYEAASEGRSPVEVWQYEYKGQSVFYLPLSRIFCCDILSVLYDSEGEVICRPDGGFTGLGDGRCPDFATLRSEGKLVRDAYTAPTEEESCD